MSTSYTFLDADMGDDDCSEDYEDDPFFQLSGQAYFNQLSELKQKCILADREREAAAEIAEGSPAAQLDAEG